MNVKQTATLDRCAKNAQDSMVYIQLLYAMVMVHALPCMRVQSIVIWNVLVRKDGLAKIVDVLAWIHVQSARMAFGVHDVKNAQVVVALINVMGMVNVKMELMETVHVYAIKLNGKHLEAKHVSNVIQKLFVV